MTEIVDSTSTGSVTVRPAADALSESLTRRFLGLVRFSHTVFALPFAALACVWALSVEPAARLSGVALAARLLGVLICMVTARSAAMAFNRLVDVHIDRENPRTATRHLVTGALSARQVWAFVALNILAFIAACMLFLPNVLPLAGAIPVLLWICGYSYAKRFTAAAHLWLGVALALSPACAWIALRGELVMQNPADVLPTLALGLAIALWVSGFDVIYACQDADYDSGKKLHSIPARFGIAGALRISAGLHIAMLIALAALPVCFASLHLGGLYYAGLAVVVILVLRQHWIVSATDLRRVGEAFFQLNAIISIGLSGLAGLDCWLG